MDTSTSALGSGLLIISLIEGFIFLVIAVAWIVLPFIVSSKLRDVENQIRESNKIMRETNLYLASIDKNTGGSKVVSSVSSREGYRRESA